MATVTRAVYNLALIGFGNVGKTFVSLLERKRAEMGTRHNLEFLISGIASRKLGWLVHPSGFEPERVLAGDFSGALKVDSLRNWILESRPDAVFEATSLNPETG